MTTARSDGSAPDPTAAGTSASELDPGDAPELPPALAGLGSHAAPTPGVLQLAWPTIVGNLLYASVGMVDIKIVGSLGAQAVAAVTTGNRIFFVLQGVLMAVTAGTTAMVARAWGAGDRSEAERVVTASLVLCAAIALAMALLGIAFADEMVGIFQLDSRTLTLAATFVRWISVFNLAFAVSFALGAALRAAGDALTPLWVGALTNVVNVVLVYALVYGRLGMPSLGVPGAAIASGVAFSVGAVILVVLWTRGRLKLHRGGAGSLSRARLRELVRIGAPAGLEQVVWQLGFIAFLWIVSLYGTEPYAAYGIGVTILSFSFVVGFGFSVAAATHVGQRLGAGDPDGAARSGWRATKLSVLSMVVLGGAIVFGAEPIARFMIDDPEVVRLTVVFIYILGAVQPLMAVEFALGGGLRGAGDTRFPLLTVFTGLVGVRIVLAGIFSLLKLPVEWIFAALIADYVVKTLMLTARFGSGRWKQIRVGVRE